MASRHPSSHGPPNARSTASTSSSSNRRNLLSATHAQHAQRSRADASPSTSADRLAASQEATVQDQWQRQDKKQDASRSEPANDIIIRDEHGHFEVEMPIPLASLDESGEGVDEEEDTQKADTRLIDLLRSHNSQHIDVRELQNAVQESLQKKVASLDKDKWMYEPEEETELLQPQ